MMSTSPPPARPRWTYPKATPILVASARDPRTAKVAALGAGADDYIAKPFGADQLMSRVRAILRRPEPRNGEPLRFSA